MAETSTSRSGRLADQFEAALEGFIGKVESLSSEQWRMRGKNTPGMRINDEDEARPLGVIAHHVAVNQKVIMGRIHAVLHDAPTPPANFKEINARHANEYADTTKADVVTLLRHSGLASSSSFIRIPGVFLPLIRHWSLDSDSTLVMKPSSAVSN